MSVSQYARSVSRKSVSQTEALPGQVRNSAGGFGYGVDCWTRLNRFLVLGSEGGSYYASERKLTIENAQCILECAKADLLRTVVTIVEVSQSGRAPKNDPAIFALALLASNPAYSFAALRAVNDVCRIGTHIFQFTEAVNEFRGWGRGLRRAIANWYLLKDADSLAYQVTKYPQREGWSHRDLLRLCHAKPKNAGHKDVFQYIAQKEKWLKSKRAGTRTLVSVEEARTATTKQLVKLILEEGLVREHIPTEMLNDTSIWDALLQNMPLTAMIRNLNKLTEVGVAKPLSEGTRLICERLRDQELLRKARIHPFNLLVALKTYSSGQGFRGGKTWTPVAEINAALEDAFYLAFGTIEPTNKRHLFGIDVSGSMGSVINNTNVSCRSAAATLAMLGMRIEPRSYAFGFTNTFRDLGITARDNLEAVEKKVYCSNFGTTDCSVPMTYALQNRLEVDAFIVLTDSETYAGRQHPTVALDEYRQKMGIDAKLIVVGMVSNGFSIADPEDPRQMDVVGFDTTAPSVIADFVRHDLMRKAA